MDQAFPVGFFSNPDGCDRPDPSDNDTSLLISQIDLPSRMYCYFIVWPFFVKAKRIIFADSIALLRGSFQ